MAAKVRLKYIMNKNSSSFKNMGLSKANTPLGLHSMKRMERISQLSLHEKRNTTDGEKCSNDTLPDLTDPTSSDLVNTFSIVRIVGPALKQSIEEVSSSSRNLLASSKHKTFVELSDSDALPVVSDTEVVKGLVPDNCSIPLPTDISSTTRDSVLPIFLPPASLTVDTNKRMPNNTHSKTSPFCQFIPISKNTSPRPNSPTKSLTAEVEEVLFSALSHISFPDFILTHQRESSSEHFKSLNHSHCTLKSKPHETDMSPLSPPFSPGSPSDVDAPSPCSSSSTLSADESPLPSSNEEGDTALFQIPDSLLDPQRPTAEVPFLGFTHIPCTTVKSWFENSPAPCGPDLGLCCSIPKQDTSSLISILREQEKVLDVARPEAEALYRAHAVRHIRSKTRVLVDRLQKRFGVPCQQPSRTKAAMDIKAEILQNENAKNMSTAELLSLVRKLDDRVPVPQELELLSGNVVDSSPKRMDDIRRTGKRLYNKVKSLLRAADPDLTESSDDGSSDAEVDAALDDSNQKNVLWNYLETRATLASRSTFLTARIHDLENQLSSVTNTLKKVLDSNEDVRFEERIETGSRSPSTAGSEDASLSSSRPGKPKGLCKGKPINGCFDLGFGKHVRVSSSHLEPKQSGSISTNTDPGCSRCKALDTTSFKRQEALPTTGMHLSDPKLAKLSSAACHCNSQDQGMPCILCMGRYTCVQSVDPDSSSLLDRVSLLDAKFHPILSFDKDVPLLMYYENILKKNHAEYQVVRPVSPPVFNNHSRMNFIGSSRRLDKARSRSRKINRYARSLSEKYRNKNFRKHKLVFGKWKKFQHKSAFRARNRIRHLSVASSGSSHDSPILSPGSSYEDGFGYDLKRRRDDNQFDIDDVIIPYSNKKSRLVKFEFKDIEIPSWRSKAFGNLQAVNIEEDTSDAAFMKRHEGYEIEEHKIIRTGGGAKCFFNTWQKRSSGMHHFDSRADSSGANTPDPVLLYDQDIVFQDTNSQSNPSSPPALFSHLVSDDSQPAQRGERRRSGGKRVSEEGPRLADYDEVAPYSPRTFPLPDSTVEDMLADADHLRYDTDVTLSGHSCPPSPDISTSSALSEEDDDRTDPEWRVVRRESGPEQNIIVKLKLAKR